MAKILIAGDMAVITSSKKLEDIKTLEKYSPKSLSLMEPDENGKPVEVFRIASTEGAGSINPYGACFGSVTRNPENPGLAVITMPLPRDLEDPIGYVSDTIGSAVVKLNKIEEGINLALATVKAQKDQILANIEVQ